MKKILTFEELLTYRYLHAEDFYEVQAKIGDIRERMSVCSDAEIVRLWGLFGDVPVGIFDEEGELLEDAEGSDEDPIDEHFFLWSRGTPRDDVWKWFDHYYRLGLYELMHAKEDESEDDTNKNVLTTVPLE